MTSTCDSVTEINKQTYGECNSPISITSSVGFVFYRDQDKVKIIFFQIMHNSLADEVAMTLIMSLCTILTACTTILNSFNMNDSLV